VEKMSVRESSKYAELLAKAAPTVIHTEEENERYSAMLSELGQNHRNLSAGERKLAELLALLVEDFEEKHYQLPKASPIEAISFLMEQNGLKQKDLVDVFGTPSIVSEVLNGKRDLNKDHISRLSKRFHVSPELFF
jgi:HTH-type transcriptional regulator / antitoxin HigA